jgi:redox-sensing transcriptional repressor
MKAEKISELTTNRLSVYLRCLNQLAAKGRKTVSSSALAGEFHLNSAQIRKDLANFGEFGVRGVGYYVDSLRDHLTRILGIDREHYVCIIGAGRMGAALSDYYRFTKTNFKVIALFDTDPRKIGKKINGIEIFDIKTFSPVAKRDKIEVAIIAVPAEFAQSTLDRVTRAGIRAVMNLAPVPLKAKGDVKVKSVDLTICLEGLSFFLAEEKSPDGGGVDPDSKARRKYQ